MRDKLHGRVVGRRWVVEMALPVIAIRWSTDEHGAQPRLASKRVRVLPKLRTSQILCEAIRRARVFHGSQGVEGSLPCTPFT